MQPGQTTRPEGEEVNSADTQESMAQNQSSQNQYVQYDQNPTEQSFVYTGNSSTDDWNQNGIEEVSWQASEYISHKKTAMWYLTLFFVGLALTVGLYFLINDILSVSVIGLGLFAFAVYGSRKPGVLHYSVDESGVSIENKFYSFNRFRSFAVARDHGVPTIILYPTQRYLPPLSLYCSPDDFQQIASTIGAFLPETEHKPDFVEQMMSRLRF